MAIVNKLTLLASELKLGPVIVKMRCNDFRRELDLPMVLLQTLPCFCHTQRDSNMPIVIKLTLQPCMLLK